MPPNRSRTHRWRDQLELIRARGGGLELSLQSDNPQDDGPDLVWRVRLLELQDDSILVESLGAAGASIDVPVGTRLVVGMTVGQNRWMFLTRVRASGRHPAFHDRSALALDPPERIERCRRRSFHRISSASVSLPHVDCWSVLDPTSVLAAEVANRAQISDRASDPEQPAILPEVGPKFTANLENISGGGAGLVIPADQSSGFDRSRILWIRVDLRPRIAAPLGVTARVAHAHRDIEQNMHAGLAFEFQFNPPHRAFVVDQICRYVEAHRLAHPGEQAA